MTHLNDIPDILHSRLSFMSKYYEKCSNLLKCIMEIESESSENWLIFWRLFSQVLSDYLEVPTIFNPIRWFLDGNGNQWKSF